MPFTDEQVQAVLDDFRQQLAAFEHPASNPEIDKINQRIVLN